jgi:hypothetical protein
MLVAILLAADVARAQSGSPAPTLQQLYANAAPDFLESRRQPYELSLQKWFYNMSQVEHDYRVDALLKKGDELMTAGDFRGAIKMYHEVESTFPDDMWLIQPDGIFVRSAHYVQRQLLRMPDEQLLYYRTLHVDAKRLLENLDQLEFQPPAYFRQVRNPQYTSLGDYDLLPEPSVPIDRREFVWSEALPRPEREWYVRALPWIAGNYVYYLHHNVLFCRSVLTGKLNWQYAPGGLLDSFDTTPLSRFHTSPSFHPESDLLIQDGLVYASVFKDGPSLVAVDRITGQLRWAKGAIVASDDQERDTRSIAAPAPGRNVIYAPFVYEDIEGNSHLTSRAGVKCFDSQTGQLIWSRDVCTLTPPKFTTSSRVRRIRVFGMQPTVRDGFVYHCTNAGMVAKLDALSGDVVWMTRYPHDADAHDLLQPVQGPRWFSRQPRTGPVRVGDEHDRSVHHVSSHDVRALWNRLRVGD